ncbi:putative PHD finger domain protein [Cladophialophora carrionii]|uniref:Transcription factor BYE1 n=1 Tax=Cladophialophora carrionii TaxID=86049 RepID=A0A1C1CYE6_9EURO|nr:putative PHD finger domain protein [Cladophialophora carrionii]
MADEPRRSGRATKGQHTKERDVPEDGITKKKGKGKAAKNKAVEEEEEEPDEIIRCVCGQYEEEEDNPRTMICCDKCSAWQHNSCMGLPEDYEPEKYFCEQCKPQDHKALLAAVARGEKPWEEAIRQREAELAEKAKKKGKKGRKSAAGRTSEVASRASQDVDEASGPGSISTPTAAGQKRKLEDSPSVSDVKVRLLLPQNEKHTLTLFQSKKVRGIPAADANGGEAIKTETPSRQASRSESVSGVAMDAKELTNASRKSAAANLIKLIEQQIKAVKPEEYTKPAGKTDTEIATQLGLRIEHGMFNALCGGNGEPNDAYKNQLRSITYNVKKNRTLGVRLLNGDLSPNTLASMDPKDMATDEQKSKEKAMIKEMERQHTIVEEQGPRIRRTHKGDEYVDEARQVAAESATSNAPVRKPSAAAEQDGEGKSPGVKSPSETQPAAARGTRPRTSVDTARRTSSANFDIDKVWSNVQGSPDGETQRFGDLPQAHSPPAAVREPMAPGTTADAEIDELLKDEDAESPPYSPKDAADAEGVVWRGVVNGGSLGRFHAVARHAAGATPDSDTLRMTYSDLLPAEIDIGGRIQPARADEYLCGLEYSNSSDLVIVCLPEPTNSQDQEQFNKFFRYFKHKDRFGVGLQYTNPAIKDIYLIPLEVGEELPTFVKKLETDFPDPTQEKMLLVPIVIKNSELPHNIDATMADAPATNARSPTMPGGSIAQTPITPRDGAFPYSQSPMPNVYDMNGTPQIHHAQQGFVPAPAPSSSSPPNQSTIYAQTILGPELASCPSVVQLCSQAPNAGENEFRIVKECLQQNAEARNDLSVLTVMLQRVMQQSKAGGATESPRA